VLLLAAMLTAAGPRRAGADTPSALLSGYTMSSWTLTDGVPIGPVYAMVQDHEGYLWLGTTGGIVRFDGARFTRWDAIHTTPLPHGDVRALSCARDGTILAGFDRLDGAVTVAALRNGSFVSSSNGSPPHDAVTSVVEDRSGSVWAVSDGALYRLRRGSWDRIQNAALGHEVVSVREDARGSLWIGTRLGVFRTRDGESFELVSQGIARETSESADGALWMTDPAHGVRRHGARAPLTGLDGWGTRLLHDSRGNLWVGTTGQGLWRVRATADVERPLIEMATMQTGLASNAVTSLLEDRDGTIWVGTMLGLHGLTPQQLTPLASGALVRAILPDADGSMWVGTTSGLQQFRQEGGAWRGRRLGAARDIRALSRDASGVAWVTTDRGLHVLNNGSLRPSSRQPDIAPPCSAGAAPDPARIQAGAAGWRSVCGTRDVTWTATSTSALTLRQGDRTIATLSRSTSSSRTNPYEIDAIFEDASGSTWVGGAGGLWRIRNGEVQHRGERDGLPAQRVMAVAQSGDGYLWLAVDRGPLYAGRRAALVRLHPTDFERAASANARLTGYRIYDVVNGLAGVPLGSAAAARSTDGSLWFAIGGNLTVLDPAQLAREQGHAEAPARIVGATVDDRPVGPAATGVLPAGTRKVQIDYSALRLSSSRQTRFRYRLDGFDRDWVDAGGRRQAYYTNLAPGQYAFRVQASDDAGMWSAPEARWSFRLRPAFQQTGWFYALCGAGVLIAAWGAAHTRGWILNRQFAAALAERTRLSREIHDTMLQSLVGIALQVQAIARQCGAHAAEPQAQLIALRRQVEQHVREARQAILNLRSPMLEVGDLATALAEIGRRTAESPTRVEVSADPIDGLAPAAEGELLRIGQEAITNAARHAGATRIRVDLRQESGLVTLRVTDDGRGFDIDETASAATGHYGLTGMRERAARAGGRLTIRSSTGGTFVEAIVPRGRQRA
jgi:signal transduction histidine kinase/ligand-binding sensor domain-containing protein